MEKMESTTRDKLIWLLTVLMFSSFFILEVISWGKYVLLVATVLIALLNPYGVKIRIDKFQRYLLMFSLFCFASAIWAWLPAKAIESGVTIIEILICFSLVYGYYIERENVGELLSVVEWSAFIVSIYAIVYYGGFSAIKLASTASELRLDNAFSNVNEIGMLSAIGCVLIVNNYFIERKIKAKSIFAIPELLMIAATQSRKAFVILVVGVLLIMFFKSVEKGEFVKSLFKVILIVLIAFIIFRIVLNLNMFEGLFARFTEGGSVRDTLFSDNESLRSLYIKIGWEQFTKTPILGIGIGSSEKLLKLATGNATYTHCNYVEMLACGGIIGFFVYYSMYVFIGKEMWKYREFDDKYSDICIVLIVLLLISDYGVVTYFSKERYFYLMMLFIEGSIIQKEYWRNQI